MPKSVLLESSTQEKRKFVRRKLTPDLRFPFFRAIISFLIFANEIKIRMDFAPNKARELLGDSAHLPARFSVNWPLSYQSIFD